MNENMSGKIKAVAEIDTRKWKQGIREIKTSTQQLKKDINSGQSNFTSMLNGVGGIATKVGKQMTKSLTAPLVGIGAVLTKVAGDFQKGMSKVKALSGATGAEMEKLTAIARKMGKETKYSATQSAEALQYMALAGWNAEQSIKGLPAVLQLASSADMDLAQASDIVTDTMSAFNMEAERSVEVADLMAYAQSNANTTVEGMGEAMKMVAPNMRAMGYDMADTTAILAKFADQGVKGSMSGTRLNAVLRDMKAHAEDGRISINDQVVSIKKADGTYRDLLDVIEDMNIATSSLDKVQKDQALSTVFSGRALSGLNLILNSTTSEIKDFEEELRSSDGYAKQVSDTMEDNLWGSLTKLKSALSEMAISLGNTLLPMIRKATERVNEWVDKFNDLDDSTKENIVKFGLFVGAIGPVLLAVGGMIKLFGTLITVIKGVRVALTFLSAHPIVFALTAIIGGIIALNHNLAKSREEMQKNYELYKKLEQERVDKQMVAIEKAHQDKLKIIETEHGDKIDALTTEHNMEMSNYLALRKSAKERAEEKLENLKKDLQGIDTRKNTAIQAIRDEYGVFNKIELSKTDIVKAKYKGLEELEDDKIKKLEENLVKEIKIIDDKYKISIEKAKEELSAKKKLIDEETSYKQAQLDREAGLEIGLIDDKIAKLEGATDEEISQAKKSRLEREAIRLESLIAEEDDSKKRKELTREREEIITQVTKLAEDSRLEKKKWALREDILAIKLKNEEKKREAERKAEEEKTREETEHTAKLARLATQQEKEVEKQKTHTATLKAEVELRKAEYEKEKVAEIKVIQDTRIAKENAETAKFEAMKKSIKSQIEKQELFLKTVSKLYEAEMLQKKEQYAIDVENYKQSLNDKLEAEKQFKKKQKQKIQRIEANKTISALMTDVGTYRKDLSDGNPFNNWGAKTKLKANAENLAKKMDYQGLFNMANKSDAKDYEREIYVNEMNRIAGEVMYNKDKSKMLGDWKEKYGQENRGYTEVDHQMMKKINGVGWDWDKYKDKYQNGYATGTNNARAGWRWVGEQGPELMNFSGGEQVVNNVNSTKLASTLAKANNPQGLIDYRKLADAIASKIKPSINVSSNFTSPKHLDERTIKNNQEMLLRELAYQVS